MRDFFHLLYFGQAFAVLHTAPFSRAKGQLRLFGWFFYLFFLENTTLFIN
jgi:hypothetical protein